MGKNKVSVILAMNGEEKFNQQIGNINKQIALLQTKLINVAKAYDGNANSLQALQARQQVLVNIQTAYHQKLDTANTGLNKATENYGKQGERLEELEKQLRKAKDAQEGLEKSGSTSSKAYERQCKKAEELSKAIENQRLARMKESGSITDWNQRIEDSEQQLRELNRALVQNEQYMQEASSTADECARSIDRFGNEVGEGTSKKPIDWKDKYASAFATRSFNFVVNTAGAMASKAVKDVVDVGSSFEAGMSEVSAISNATAQEMDKLSEKAKSLGETTKFTATEAAEAFKFMSVAGWSAEEMLLGIDGVMNLAAVSGMDLAEASGTMADYLSAFNMEAGQSSHMADMLAYAQANSSATAEQLGEAYGNCAANLSTAGQDVETVTSLLEAMANQGLKGSEAGAALGSMMTQISEKMENGRIKIGETLVAVADSNGNFRDMTDILMDVEDALTGMSAEEQSAALAATFSQTALSGLNLVLNEGMDKVAEYEESLRSADGAAACMAASMQDNLAGDMAKAGAALEGLGVAAYDFIDGPARGVVKGVTSIINGITDAITPQKSELQTFIEEVDESNQKVSGLLENARESMDQATGEVAGLGVYKEKLLELNSEMEKTEFQKYEMRNIVSELKESIPQLAAAFDNEACKINLSNEEIEKLIENQEAFILQQATMKAKIDAESAYEAAILNVAKMEAALEKAQEKLAEAQEKNQKSEGFLAGGIGDFYEEILEYEEVKRNATKALEEAVELETETKEELQLTEEAIESVTKEAAEGTGVLASQTNENMEAVSAAAEEAAEAFGNLKESIADSIENSVNMLEEFSGGTEATAEEIRENLDSQIEGISQWSENMQILAGAAGQGMSQALYDALAEMGPESANLVNTLVETLNADMEQGTSVFGEICKKWQEAMKLQDESEVVASYTSLKDGIGETMKEATEAAKDAAEEEKSGVVKTMQETTEETAQAMEDRKENVVKTARETTQEALKAMQEKTQDFNNVGYQMISSVAVGMTEASGLVYNKVRRILEQAKEAADRIANSRSTSHVKNSQPGADISKGFALGIRKGQKDVVSASVDLAKAALLASQKELEIHSPSKVFRDQVGKQIPAGVTLGIKQGTGEAAKSAKDFAAEVFKEASDQLEKLKKNNVGKMNVTLDDLEWYWDRLLKKSKKKGEAYYSEMKKLVNAQKKQISQQRKAEGLSAQDQALDAYKLYYHVSAFAEMEYWDKARKKYKKGTDERLKADQKYYSAKKSYYSQLEKLDEDYAKKRQEVDDKLKEQIESLEESYQSALSGRKSEIKSAFGVFDEFLSEADTPDMLLENMESQVQGYAIWVEQLAKLEEKGILGEDFLEELRQMGPKAAATVASLNLASQEQLLQMQKMWEAKDRLAERQAQKETEALRKSTEEQIREATKAAQEELAACKSEYEAAYAELTEGISEELAGLVSDAYKSGQDAVAALINAIREKTKDKDTKKEIQNSGKGIGENMLEGMLSSLEDKKKIKKSAKEFVEVLEKEIKKAAGIASPSRRFRDAVGVQIPAGVAQGILAGAKDAAEAGTEMIDMLLEQSAERLKQQSNFAAELSGIHADVGILSVEQMGYTQMQQAANVTVNSAGLEGMFGSMLAELQNMREEMRRMKIVLDSGALVGELAEGIGGELVGQAIRF